MILEAIILGACFIAGCFIITSGLIGLGKEITTGFTNITGVIVNNFKRRNGDR